MSFQIYFTGKEVTSFEQAIRKLYLPKQTQFVKMEQIHNVGIQEVYSGTHKNYITNLAQNTKESLNKNDLTAASVVQAIPQVDAVFTSEKNFFLSVKSADCLPILMYGVGIKNELSTEFVAAIHAGRKSTQSKILFLLLEKLNDTYNLAQMLHSNQQPLMVWFGPAICKNCYQIDRTTNLHYDLIAENKKQIIDFFEKHSLNPQTHLKLDVENHCTLHEPEKYYSYRATGPGVKMNYSFIGIQT